MKQIPIIAIVGSPNAGKSSLFNALVGGREAIVTDIAGTTRDNVQRIVEHDDKHYWLVDTAGVEDDASDELEAAVQNQAADAIEFADVILYVVAADAPLTDHDRRLAKRLLKSQKPVILIASKADRTKFAVPDEMKKLGVRNMLAVSSTQRQGVADVLPAVAEIIPPRSSKLPQSELSLALLGRPNVGKSSLFNELLGEQRAVIAAKPGTTRDANQAEVTYHKQRIQLIDTAGVRRSKHANKGIEYYSSLRTIAAINRADVCVVVLDASEPSRLDQKIAGMVRASGKGLIIALNKWDLVAGDELQQKMATGRVEHDFQFVWWAPMVITSATERKNLPKLIELGLQIKSRMSQQVKTTEVNRILAQALRQHTPSARRMIAPRLKYASQTESNPPKILIHGARGADTHWSYRRYLEKVFREHLELVGVPLRIGFVDTHKDQRKRPFKQRMR